MEEKKESVGFRVIGGKGNTFTGCVDIGHETAFEAKGTKDLSVDKFTAIAREAPSHVMSDAVKQSPAIVDDGPAHGRDDWYKKPIGVILLGAAAIVLATIVIAGINHFYPWIKP
jgi:hypothetical protein